MVRILLQVAAVWLDKESMRRLRGWRCFYILDFASGLHWFGISITGVSILVKGTGAPLSRCINRENGLDGHRNAQEVCASPSGANGELSAAKGHRFILDFNDTQ